MSNILFLAWSFLKRDFRINLSYRVSFMLDILSLALRIPVFFFLSVFIDSLSNSASVMDGMGYFPFVITGIALSDYFSRTIGACSGSMREAQQQGTLEPLAASRTGILTVVIMSGLYPVLYGMLHLLLYISAGLVVSGTPLSEVNFLSLLVTLLVSTLSFLSLSLVSSVFVLLFKRGNPVNWIISNVSWLLSGILYPVEILPGWLKGISDFLPLTHCAKAARQSLFAGACIKDIAPELIYLGLISAAIIPTGVFLLRYSMRIIKKENGFSHY